jgi:zinc transporter 5/7
MGSVGVIISTLLIKFYGWTGFDPIASLFIAILIVASVVPLVIDTGKILCLDVSSRSSRIDGAMAEVRIRVPCPPRHALNRIQVSAVPGVASYERARFWPKDGNSLVGSLVIRLEHAPGSVDPTGPHSSAKSTYASVDRVVGRVDAVLRQHIRGLEELTIQVNGD